MSNRVLLFVVLLSLFVAPIVRAEDKPAEARRAALVKAGYTPVPLTVGSEGRFYTDATLEAAKVKFLLDSGLRETLIDVNVARALRLRLSGEYHSTSVSGESVGRVAVLPGITIGGYDTRQDLNTFPVVARNLAGLSNGAGGVFGQGVLDSWAAVIDLPARRLFLRSPLTTAWPRLAGTWTVTSWQEDGEARKLDKQAPPTITFADRRLRLADGGQTREYAIHLVPREAGDRIALFDPKQERQPDPAYRAGGLIKVADRRMTVCLFLDINKVKGMPATFAAPKGSGYALMELKDGDPHRRPPADALRERMLKDGYSAVRFDREPGSFRMATARVGERDLHLLLDTGAGFSVFESGSLDKWGARRVGAAEALGFSGNANGEQIEFRGLKFGKYDTRRAWSVLYGGGFDLAGINKVLADQKRPSLDGLLGCLDLRTGSAVIDFGSNTLYLKPVKQTLWPQIEGKWVGVKYESDGRTGQYKPGDAAVEFKDGRIRFATKIGAAEWGFHLRDEGNVYRVGLFDPKADELADAFTYASAGAIRLAGGKLTLVMEQGRARLEPTGFSAPAGSGLLLVEYERAK